MNPISVFLFVIVAEVIGNSKTKACKADHNLCASFSGDGKYYCRHEWLRGNCRHMCGRGCYDPDEDYDDFRAGILGGESCLTDCSGFNDDPVCGTNGKTYKNICEIYNDVCRRKVKFEVRGRGTCVCQDDDRKNCKEYENYKSYYCRHPWVKRNCRYFCGHCVPKPRCSGKVDVGFIFEPTRGLTIAYQKYFIKTLAAVFGVSRDDSRAAIITLGKRSEFSINFGDYEKMNPFNEAVDGISQPEGNEAADINEALAIAHHQMFSEANELRSDSRKLLIILVRNPEKKVLTGAESLYFAEQLRKKGVVVVAIGTSPEKYRSDFIQLTGDSSNVLLYPSIIDLVSGESIETIISEVCNKVTTSTSTNLVGIDSNNDVPV